jgi:hypothetical protein
MMNTYLKKFIVLMSCGAAAILLAACVTDRAQSLRTSAAHLDDASSEFSAEIRHQGDDSSRDLVSRDAEALAKAAHNFDQALSRGDSRAEVADEYRRVVDNYEQLHERLAAEGYAAQNRRVLEDFDRVTVAYRQVSAAMDDRVASTRY